MALGTSNVKESCGQTHGKSRWTIRAEQKLVAKKARRHNDKKLCTKEG